MNLVHNPQSVANGYISMTRNIFSVSSIGLAAMSFSKNFEEYEKFVIILAIYIFCFCILYGIKISKDFNDYLNYIKQQKKNVPEVYSILFKKWKGLIIFTYLYLIFIVILIILIIMRKIIK